MLKNRIEYGLISAVAILLFLFYHNFFFFYLLVAVCVLPVISCFVSKKVFGSLKISVSINVGLIEPGNDIPINIEVENNTFFPMPGIKMEFIADNQYYPNSEVQEINLPLRRGKNTYGWSVNSIYAGRVRFIGKELRMNDFLGIFRFSREWNEEASVSVIPVQSEVIMGAIENTFTEGDRQESDSGPSVEDVTQIKEFREYRPGDRLQRIHWKLSTKHDELYVKEFEQQYNRTLTLLVELRRDGDEPGFLDELFTAFYSAALKLIEMDIQFHIQWYDIENGSFRSEFVDNEDNLIDVIQQMYMMNSYDDYHAFNNYSEIAHKEQDLAIYFTPPSFTAYDAENVLGTYKNKVVLICL